MRQLHLCGGRLNKMRLASQNRTRLSVIVFGRKAELSLLVLKAVAQRHDVVGIIESQFRGYTSPASWQRALNRVFAPQDIETFARKNNIPFFVMRPGETTELGEFIRKANPSAGVIAKMVQLLPMEIVSLFPLGILNIHPSLLPLYRGPIPVFWAIYNQETLSGLTIHLVDQGEDTGDILEQKELPIAFGESAEEFGRRYTKEAPAMVMKALDNLAAGRARPRSQRALPCPFRARFLKRGEDPIKWDEWPVERIYQALRAADSILDLLPARRFPLSLCDWRVSSFDRKPCAAPGKHISGGIWRCFIPLRDGRVFLEPRFSLWQLRCGLKEIVSRRS